MSTAKQLSQLEQIKNRIKKMELEKIQLENEVKGNKDVKTNIYILKLQNDKYYIGKTDNVEKRFLEHVNGKGSTWTQLYKPISVEKIISNSSPFDEDKYVKEYMSKYGIENVRGGSYVREILDEVSRFSLQKEIWAANDCCTQCGRKGHFVKDCKDVKQQPTNRKNRNKVYNNSNYDDEEEYIQIWECDHCEKQYEDKSECAKHEKLCKSKKLSKTCFQCGETGHYANECTNEEEDELFSCSYCDKEFETEKGVRFHENVYCRNKSKNYGGGGIKYNTCSRCGRVGHNASKCYARTDADGDDLDSVDS
jgi:predicted GIY-YIG superfamily endonuclease